jgi:hypothetical protein
LLDLQLLQLLLERTFSQLTLLSTRRSVHTLLSLLLLHSCSTTSYTHQHTNQGTKQGNTWRSHVLEHGVRDRDTIPSRIPENENVPSYPSTLKTTHKHKLHTAHDTHTVHTTLAHTSYEHHARVSHTHTHTQRGARARALSVSLSPTHFLAHHTRTTHRCRWTRTRTRCLETTRRCTSPPDSKRTPTSLRLRR